MRSERGFSLLDFVVVLALVALLVYLVGLDRRAGGAQGAHVPVVAGRLV